MIDHKPEIQWFMNRLIESLLLIAHLLLGLLYVAKETKSAFLLVAGPIIQRIIYGLVPWKSRAQRLITALFGMIVRSMKPSAQICC